MDCSRLQYLLASIYRERMPDWKHVASSTELVLRLLFGGFINFLFLQANSFPQRLRKAGPQDIHIFTIKAPSLVTSRVQGITRNSI